MKLHLIARHFSGRSARLYLFGDLHQDDPYCRLDLWQEWKEVAQKDEKAMIIGTGDYIDVFRHKTDMAIHKAVVGDEKAQKQLDDLIKARVKKYAQELEPIKHKILGLLEGNHTHWTMGGYSSTQYLCDLLEVPYLTDMAFIRVSLELSGSCYNIDIHAAHGSGGTKTLGAEVGKMEREVMPYWLADIYVRAHSHKIMAIPMAPVSKLVTNKGRLVLQTRNRWALNTGGFLDGYKPDVPEQSYVQIKNLPPVALGWCWAEFKTIKLQGVQQRLQTTGHAVVPQKEYADEC